MPRKFSKARRRWVADGGAASGRYLGFMGWLSQHPTPVGEGQRVIEARRAAALAANRVAAKKTESIKELVELLVVDDVA